VELLKIFVRPPARLKSLPSGCFTVAPDGRVLVSTLPEAFSAELTREIGLHVLTAIRTAREARLPLFQLIIRYSSLKITARDLRGGAIIFLAPQTLSSTPG
jgi:hypothetical protein